MLVVNAVFRSARSTVLVALASVLVLVVGTVVGTNLVTAEPASSPAPVTVTFNYSGATGGNTLPSDTVTSGTQADAELPHPTKPGESFTGWFNTQSLLNGQRITTIEENDAGTLIAGFIPPALAQTLNLAMPVAPTCANGLGTCVLGNIGPGGGLVFYDAGSVQPWGRYLEMAPKTWSGFSSDDTPTLKWCTVLTNVEGAVGTAIGTGKVNTAAMAASVSCSSSAAVAVLAYPGTNTSAGQWFLPSKDELNAMCSYSRTWVGSPSTGTCPAGGQNADFAISLYGFSGSSEGGAGEDYWSSSQSAEGSAWYQGFFYHFQNIGSKSNSLRIRPIRAF